MSHTVQISVQFKTSELKHVLSAFNKLNWKVVENTIARAYSKSQEATYTYVAQNPIGTFDIGITPGQDEDAPLSLKTDTFDRTIEQQLGAGFSKLKRQFGLEVIEDVYGAGSYTTETNELGETIVTVEQYA